MAIDNSNNIRSHRDLAVWQKAMDLAVLIYRCSGAFPREEQFRLRSQVTRAAVSVPANVAEGLRAVCDARLRSFSRGREGSLMETETLMTVAVRPGYLGEPDAEGAFELITQLEKMLTVLRKKVLA